MLGSVAILGPAIIMSISFNALNPFHHLPLLDDSHVSQLSHIFYCFDLVKPIGLSLPYAANRSDCSHFIIFIFIFVPCATKKCSGFLLFDQIAFGKLGN